MADSKFAKHLKDFESFLCAAKPEFENKLVSKMQQNGRMNDFTKIKTLGTGSFGRVLLVKHKKTKGYFAMKLLDKQHVVKMKQVEHTISEIKLLNAIKFEFLISLTYFFKDNVYLYMVMPFVNGGEMFTHLRAKKRFDEELAKFYVSQVTMAFEYMHHLGMVYRDLKPENILLDQEGYIRIADLGFCKKIDDTRTWTLCGTPEYLAPEVILSKGYNYSVDWWSLGVLTYEMTAGYPPFFARDPIKIYEKIVAGRFIMPIHMSKHLKDLLPRLLQVDRSKRYGNLKGGAKDLKRHEWFTGFDWDAVLNRRLKSLFIPKIGAPEDTSNFETYEEAELRFASRDEFGPMFDSLYGK